MIKVLVLLSCLIATILEIGGIPINKAPGLSTDKFEGDIKLNEEQQKFIQGISPNTGIRSIPHRWPTNLQGYVVVPYVISASEGYTASDVAWIQNEFRLIESRTCVRFIPRTFEIDFLNFVNNQGCWSFIGRQSGLQEIGMDRNGCLFEGIVVHEIIHTLGFRHMHDHNDRDNYVRIVWENIAPQHHPIFEIATSYWYDDFNTPYDFRSIMHYSSETFTQNGLDTIIPHDPSYLSIIGQDQISEGDVTRINRMYMCRT